MVKCGFIDSYLPWNKERGEYYKLIDEFTLFYIYWILNTASKHFTPTHWLRQIQKPIYHVWAGYAFEAVCYKHIEQVIKALNIKTAESTSTWRLMTHEKGENGTQIDMLIERSDDAINICEIKYTDQPFAIDKSYAINLERKIATFKKSTGTQKQIFLSFISANGIKPTVYSEDMVTGIVTLNDLFLEDD